MSNYSDPITATGSLISFDAQAGGVFDSLSAPIHYTQEGSGTPSPTNIRPIIGHNSLSVYVSPNTQQAQATTYNVSFGDAGTVYTGTVDVITGVLTVTHGIVDATTLEWVRESGGVNGRYFTSTSPVPFKGWQDDGGYAIAACNALRPAEYTASKSVAPANSFWWNNAATGWRCIYGATTATLAQFTSFLADNNVVFYGELANPLTYQLTPTQISALVGSNNVWVDTGAVITLIYRLLIVDRQTGSTAIGKNAESLIVSKQFGSYSKVVINVTSELYYESGNDTGRTLTISCPWGTQAMADNILASLQGYQYQPYEAQNAILDPAAELGDGLTVNGVYGGIFKQTLRSGVLHSSDVSAPQDEEIDHEYKFTPAAERKIERRINNMESELSVQADQISAKVDRHGGDHSSVSWTMDSDVFKVQADGNDVLTIDENGLTVNGDGTFTGSVQAKNIRYGGSSGTFSGGGISGGSIGTSKFTSGINVSLGNADYSADVFSGAVVASWTKVQSLQVVGTFFLVGTLNRGGQKFDTLTKTVKDGSGNNITIHYLGY